MRSSGFRQFQSGFGFSTRVLAEFDPDRVRPLPLEVVHDFPTGAKHIEELSNTYYHANHG